MTYSHGIPIYGGGGGGRRKYVNAIYYAQGWASVSVLILEISVLKFI